MTGTKHQKMTEAAPPSTTAPSGFVDSVCCALFYTLFWGQPFVIVGGVVWLVKALVTSTSSGCTLLLALVLACVLVEIVALLFVWTRGSLQCGTRWARFCNCALVRRATRAMGCRIEFTGGAPQPQQRSTRFILGVHPHGISAIERVLFWGARDERWDRAFPGVDTRDLIASTLMLAPGARLWCLWSGCVAAGRQTAKRVLQSTDCSLLLYPGGEKEALLASPDHHAVYVLRHKGFCRLALEHGADLLPCYVFGATQQFSTSTWLMGLRRWVQSTLSIAVPLFWGNALLPWVPRRSRPLVAVVGEPIRVQAVEAPTQQQVDDLHRRYVEALQRVFDDNKERLGYAHARLEIH